MHTFGISRAALHRSAATSGWEMLDAAPSTLVQRPPVKLMQLYNIMAVVLPYLQVPSEDVRMLHDMPGSPSWSGNPGTFAGFSHSEQVMMLLLPWQVCSQRSTPCRNPAAKSPTNSTLGFVEPRG